MKHYPDIGLIADVKVGYVIPSALVIPLTLSSFLYER